MKRAMPLIRTAFTSRATARRRDSGLHRTSRSPQVWRRPRRVEQAGARLLHTLRPRRPALPRLTASSAAPDRKHLLDQRADHDWSALSFLFLRVVAECNETCKTQVNKRVSGNFAIQ